MNSNIKTTRRITFALALVAALVGCGKDSSPTSPSQPPPPTNVVITINGISGNMSFAPSSVSVRVGQTVAWHNADTIAHAIAQDGGGFSTGTIPAGTTSAPVTISAAGAMPYHCTIHPSMTGSLTGQ